MVQNTESSIIIEWTDNKNTKFYLLYTIESRNVPNLF